MRLIEKVWFKNHPAKYWLVPLMLPFMVLFWILSATRRLAFKLGIFKSFKVDKPVIVVGNIGVGGNGKTPVVIYLVELLKSLGLNPGVISRGYGGEASQYPYLLHQNSTAKQAGDEPILIYQRCQVPVVVGADRVADAQRLIEQDCDVVICDDGLQHYRLKRDVEIIVIDEKRRFGNGLLLPAGPLREGQWRLNTADLLIYNSQSNDKNASSNGQSSLTMCLAGLQLIHLMSGEKQAITSFLVNNAKINAIAGIGDPQRFFDSLCSLGFVLNHVQGFVDHQNFTENDFTVFNDDLPLLMTEKDAVKCKKFAKDNYWYLPVDAQFSSQDTKILKEKLLNVTRIQVD